MNRELVYVIFLVLAGLFISRVLWFLPVLLILPGIIAYTTDNPAWYLGVIAIAAELISVLPFGVVAVVVLMPWLVRHLNRRTDVNVSFSFILLVLLVVGGQMFVLFLPDSGVRLFGVLNTVPWFGVMMTIALSSLFVFGASVIIHFNKTW
ncbi:MAG: hypothetical protein ABIH36_00770 [bacterium]